MDKRRHKKWLALFLSVSMVMTTGVVTTGYSLMAKNDKGNGNTGTPGTGAVVETDDSGNGEAVTVGDDAVIQEWNGSAYAGNAEAVQGSDGIWYSYVVNVPVEVGQTVELNGQKGDWKVVSGGQNISVQGTNGHKLAVTGVHEGAAQVREMHVTNGKGHQSKNADGNRYTLYNINVKASASIEVANLSKTYDGSPLVAAVASVTSGATVEYSTDGSSWSTTAPSLTNAGSMTVLARASKNGYTTEAKQMTLTVNKATVKVTSASDEKTYDGEALTATDAEVTGLVNGETATATTTGTQTKVGRSTNTVNINWGSTNSNNYNVDTTGLGTLTVDPKEVTVTPKSTGKTYGEDDNITKLTAKVTGLLGDDKVEYELSREAGENAGEYTISASGEELQGNYKVVFQTATFNIKRADVKVKANDMAKTYGDEEPTLTATITGLVNGDAESAIEVLLKRAEGEKPGSYKITASGEKVQGNYNVTYENGTFTIGKKNTLVLSTNDYEGLYDGQAHTAAVSASEGATIEYKVNGSWTRTAPSATNVADSATYEVRATKEGYEDVTGSITLTVEPIDITVKAANKSKTYGETDPELTASITKGALLDGEEINYEVTREAGNNAGTYDITVAEKNATAVQGNYNVTYVGGIFTIAPKAVTVTAKDAEKTYGTEADPTLEAIVEGTINGETVDYSIARAIGETAGTYAITPSGEAAQGNYEVTFEAGTFTINKKELTITADAAEKTYGDADPVLTASVEGLVGDDTVAYTVTREEGNDAGTYAIKVNVGELENYEVTTVPATFTVNPKNVTVTPDNAGKTAGTEDPAELTARVDGLVGDDTIEYTVTRAEGEAVGTYDITAEGEAAQGNYIVEFKNPAAFTIAEGIVLTTNDYTGVYDGQAHTASAIATEDAVVSYSVDGETWTSEAPSATNVADSQTYMVKAEKEGYKTQTGEVTLTITRREIELTSGSASKPFDRTALTNDEVTVTSGSFVGGEGATYVVTGSQTEMGTSKNEFAYILKDGTNADNYKISTVYGDLTVGEGIYYTFTVHFVDEDGVEIAQTVSQRALKGDDVRINTPAVPVYTTEDAFVMVKSIDGNHDVKVIYKKDAPEVIPDPVDPTIPTEPIIPGTTDEDPVIIVPDSEPEAETEAETAVVNPAAVVTPATAVVAPTGIAAAPRAVANLNVGSVVVTDENGNDTLVKAEEVQTARNLQDLLSTDNALPFLFMMMTIMVLIAYARAMKKDQEEMNELNERLGSLA